MEFMDMTISCGLYKATLHHRTVTAFLHNGGVGNE